MGTQELINQYREKYPTKAAAAEEIEITDIAIERCKTSEMWRNKFAQAYDITVEKVIPTLENHKRVLSLLW